MHELEHHEGTRPTGDTQISVSHQAHGTVVGGRRLPSRGPVGGRSEGPIVG